MKENKEIRNSGNNKTLKNVSYIVMFFIIVNFVFVIYGFFNIPIIKENTVRELIRSNKTNHNIITSNISLFLERRNKKCKY